MNPVCSAIMAWTALFNVKDLDNSHVVAARENVPDGCRGGMPETECIFPNCERALKEQPRPRKVTLVPKYDAKAVEARRR